MSVDTLLVCSIVLVALVLFATEKIRYDVVSVSILTVLLVIGLFRPGFLSIEEALSGFSNTATVTIAAMFVLSAGLFRTGIVGAVSSLMLRRLGSGGEATIFIALLLTVGIISAFINNTAAVAVFLPITLTICKKTGISPSRLLIPISFASIVGGTCTLIGTSTNILVNSMAADRGIRALSMFEFAKLGGVFFLIGVPYLFVAARRLLPERQSADSLTGKYDLGGYLTTLEVGDDSHFVGETLASAHVGERYGVAVVEIWHGEVRHSSAIHDVELQAGALLLVKGKLEEILSMTHSEGLTIRPREKYADRDLSSEETTLAEAIIAPGSSLVGSTLAEVDFRRQHGVFALAIRQHDQTIRERVGDIILSVGDTLLLQGRREAIDSLIHSSDFLGLRQVDLPELRSGKGTYALMILAFVVVMAASGAMPILAASLLGCVLMFTAGCITPQEAYDAIDWSVILLLAGVIPLGIAIENSGTAELVARGVLNATGAYGPVALVSAFYLLATVFASIMSHHAAVVLLVPIAIATAHDLGVNPVTLLMAVAFAASSSMSTPFGYHTNLMVYGPGGYRFADYMRVGLPLNLLFWLLATLLLPQLWPLTAS